MGCEDNIYGIILKSIEDEIIKCDDYRVGNLPLKNKVKRRLKQFRKDTKDLKFERMLFLSDEGDVILEKDGEMGYVDFSEMNLNKMALDDGIYDMIIEHNHPGAYAEGRDVEGNVIFSNKMIPTILSKGDVQKLLLTGVAQVGENNEIIDVAYFKGIIAECPNGSRMSLIRKEGSGENLFGESKGETRVKFEDTYDILHNKWKHHMEDYDIQVKLHMGKWVDKKNSSNSNWTDEDYFKERQRWAKKFNKEHFNDNYLRDVIKDFDDLGFELSVEWIYD